MTAIVRRQNEYLRRYQRHHLKEIKYRGIEQIPIEKIRGSVNRWRDFDRRFRSEDADRDKLNSVLRALEQGVILPPISVYKVEDDYFVIDGNHRVTAGKKLGQIDIDAEVYELLPPGDSLSHLLWRERSFFEIKTGLNLEFSEVGSYSSVYVYLRLYAKQFNKKYGTALSVKELGQQWREEVYNPLVKGIRDGQLEACFTSHTEDDLFLFVLHHQIIKSRHQGRTVNVEEAVADFCQKPGDFGTKVMALFKSFGWTRSCRRFCLKCMDACPEGLICSTNGRLSIDQKCDGCGKCGGICPQGNLGSYDSIADSPAVSGISMRG